MDIKNSRGEQLYYILVVNTNEFPQSPTIKTWEDAKEWVKQLCREVDDDNWYNHNITLEINERLHRIKAENVRNHKGWGFDFFQYIVVDSLSYWK